MKILLLTDGIYPYVIGGMQKHSHYLAKFLAVQGHGVTLVHCVAHHAPLPTEAEVKHALGLEEVSNFGSIALHFPPSGFLPGHYLKESYLYSKNIYKRVEKELNDFDFIYAKGFAAWHLLHEKSKGKKLPPVGVKFHGYEMFQPANTLRLKLEAWLLRSPVKWNNLHADFIFSYGGKITALIKELGVGDEKIIEIPTGIEASWCMNQPVEHGRSEVHFVFVGRYERRKGVEELTVVLNELKESHKFHFHFVGPIPPSKKIKSEKITYHGQLTTKEEIQRVLDACDVLVTPSHSEGMPNVIMEGMARGLAVVATDVGAVSAVVSEENGWLIEPNDMGALQQSLQDICLMQLPELMAKRNMSLQKIAAFHWEKIGEMTAMEIQKRVAHP